MKPHQIANLQLNTIAHLLAYQFARSIIESNCPEVIDNGITWWDLEQADRFLDESTLLLAERYLQLSGRLDRHPDPDREYRLVRVLDAEPRRRSLVLRKSKGENPKSKMRPTRKGGRP